MRTTNLIIHRFLINCPIWKKGTLYITPGASLWRKWWERLVRNVRSILWKILGKACIRTEELHMLMALNTLSPTGLLLSQTMAHGPPVLSPSDFLAAKWLVALPSAAEDLVSTWFMCAKGKLIGTVLCRQAVMQQFCGRGRRHYLSQLQATRFVKSLESKQLKTRELDLH